MAKELKLYMNQLMVFSKAKPLAIFSSSCCRCRLNQQAQPLLHLDGSAGTSRAASLAAPPACSPEKRRRQCATTRISIVQSFATNMYTCLVQPNTTCIRNAISITRLLRYPRTRPTTPLATDDEPMSTPS